MWNWIKRNKKSLPKKNNEIQKLEVKPIDYHPKIILAWAKAIEGNKELLVWLQANGFPELVMATHAIFLKNDARDWLSKNGYPHILAMINGAEGNKMAQNWLLVHDFMTLYHMALAIEDEKESWEWLGKNVTQDMFILTKSIKKVKDQIEESHNDVHSFGKDA
jgi:hypothetical protein